MKTPRHEPGRKNFGAFPRLGRAEERPFPGRGLELMHPAIIGMEEVRAIGNEVSMRRANRAL